MKEIMTKPSEFYAAKDLGKEPFMPCTASTTTAKGTKIKSFNGLTKREWLAGMAMQSLIKIHHNGGGQTFLPQVSEQAVQYADALLVELAKTNSKP